MLMIWLLRVNAPHLFRKYSRNPVISKGMIACINKLQHDATDIIMYLMLFK